MSPTSSSRLLVAQTLRLRGIAGTEEVVTATGLGRDEVEAELDVMVAGDLAERRSGSVAGYSLTPEGAFILRSLLDAELRDAGVRAEVEAAYATFLEFNDDLLRVCTSWQLRSNGTTAVVPNDHSDQRYDGSVIAELQQVHERVTVVIDRVAAVLPRFERHRGRLQNALDRLWAGDHDYFTKPMFPSYHSCWFELHEDLLATLGVERRSERSQQ